MAKDAKGHGSDAHKDANGQRLQPGDRVRDRAYHEVNAQGVKSPIEGTVSRTYFAGGNPSGQPLIAAKFGGATVTRSPGAVERIGGSGEAHVAGIASQHGIPTGHLYNRDAVNNAIASSNRAGRKIGGKEAKAIHALLKGRH